MVYCIYGKANVNWTNYSMGNAIFRHPILFNPNLTGTGILNQLFSLFMISTHEKQTKQPCTGQNTQQLTHAKIRMAIK